MVVAPSAVASSAPAQQTSPTPSPNIPTFSGDSSSGSENPTGNLAPGVTSNCSKYYTVQSGDTCNSVAQMFGTTFTQLQALNTELDSDCSNLWLGYAYCVAA
jgi:LysM repeat protein